MNNYRVKYETFIQLQNRKDEIKNKTETQFTSTNKQAKNNND